jgi:hypothetical protein
MTCELFYLYNNNSYVIELPQTNLDSYIIKNHNISEDDLDDFYENIHLEELYIYAEENKPSKLEEYMQSLGNKLKLNPNEYLRRLNDNLKDFTNAISEELVAVLEYLMDYRYDSLSELLLEAVNLKSRGTYSFYPGCECESDLAEVLIEDGCIEIPEHLENFINYHELGQSYLHDDYKFTHFGYIGRN